MADIMVGPSRQYNHTQLLNNHWLTMPTVDEVGAVRRILLGASPKFEIWDLRQGGWEHKYSYTNSDWDIINAGSESTEEDDVKVRSVGKPPTFPPTGPVFTPLDPAGIPQKDYTPFYPQSYMPADPAYPSMGLLSQPAFGGTDLYQPWSDQYGSNVAPESLWNYKPPSGLDVGPGPKVGYVK